MATPYAPISAVLPRTQAVAGLNQSIYGTNWSANEASDILVYVTPSGVPALDTLQLIPTNQYTVQFIGPDNIVQVTFGFPYIPAQFSTVTIMRAVPSEFINLYTNTNFTPSMLNGDFESLTFVDQQNELYWQALVPRYNNSASINVPIDTVLPILKANEFWIKNSTNTAFIAATLGDEGQFPVLGPFVLFTTDSNYPESFNLGSLATGILAQTTLLGVATPYTIPFPLDVELGGTGLSSITPFAVLLGGSVNTDPIVPLADIGVAGQVLTSSGPGLEPSWQDTTPVTPGINQVVVQKFSISGTYTPNADMAYCVIECVGGGGGGGGTITGAAGISFIGGGGGAGGYSRITLAAASIGASKAVTIGAGGVGGTLGNNPGNAGSATSVGTLCVANGGSGGAANNNSIPSGGLGGTAGIGDLTVVGNYGQSGCAAFNMYAGMGAGGGGNSVLGTGAISKNCQTSSAGTTAPGYGGGGSGGSSSALGGAFAGGNGAPGYVIITEYLIV